MSEAASGSVSGPRPASSSCGSSSLASRASSTSATSASRLDMRRAAVLATWLAAARCTTLPAVTSDLRGMTQVASPRVASASMPYTFHTVWKPPRAMKTS